MASILKTFIFVILIAVANNYANAQDEQYKMEIGGMAGGSFYMGDANFTMPFKHTGMMGGILWRYNFNPHIAMKANLAMGHISGKTEDAATVFPYGRQTSFSRNIYDLGTQFECNFWGYSWGEKFKGYRRFTPYIVGGIGLTFAPAPLERLCTVNFPLGVGLKYKIGRRVNLGCEFTMRFSLSDKLDVMQDGGLHLNDPYQIKGSGFKNKDCYSFTAIFLTYDIFKVCKECNPGGM